MRIEIENGFREVGMNNTSRWLLGLVLLAVVSVSSTAVMAHGDPPAGDEVFAVDGEWVYLTNFGVMAASWPDQYVCEEAFYASEDFSIAPLATDAWVTASRTTVATTDDGCNFERVRGDLPREPSAIAALPDSGEVAYLVRDEDDVELMYSDDGGETWSELAVELEELIPTGVGFLEAGRLVVVAYEADDDIRGAPLITDIDVDAEERSDFDVDDELRYPELLDARAGDLLWYAQRDGEVEVRWSRSDDLHAGDFVASSWPAAGAIAPDGQRAYLGGIDEQGRGVFEAMRDEPSQWTEIVDGHRGMCLAATDDGRLFVCGHRDDDGHDLAVVDADGELEKLVDFRDLQGYRSGCGTESDVGGSCPAVWPELATALDIEVEDREDEAEETMGCRNSSGEPGPIGGLAVFFGVVGLICYRSQGVESCRSTV